jgi:hypothetical protein
VACTQVRRLTPALQPRRFTIALSAVGCKRMMLIQPSPCTY